jgi:hypothetical protein
VGERDTREKTGERGRERERERKMEGRTTRGREAAREGGREDRVWGLGRERFMHMCAGACVHNGNDVPAHQR